MPFSQQAKLLRVLEDRKVSKLGSRQEVAIDLRVIAATNQDTDQMIKDKKFRLDLFHRLSIFIIHIPALRERKEDIPVLLDYFVEQYSDKLANQLKESIKSG